VKTLFENVPIDQVQHITEKDYVTDGSTALYDAVDIGISRHMDAVRVMMVIVTDGEENASKYVTYNELQLKIENRKSHGWNFIYLCNNIGVSEAGVNMGFTRSAPTATFSQSNNIAVGDNFGSAITECLSAATQSFRGCSKVGNLNAYSDSNNNNQQNVLFNELQQGPPLPVETKSAVPVSNPQSHNNETSSNTIDYCPNNAVENLSRSKSWSDVIRSGYNKLINMRSHLPSMPAMTHNTNDPMIMPPLVRQTNNSDRENAESKKDTELINAINESASNGLIFIDLDDPDDDIYDPLV
jgi:hypothetical protein